MQRLEQEIVAFQIVVIGVVIRQELHRIEHAHKDVEIKRQIFLERSRLPLSPGPQRAQVPLHHQPVIFVVNTVVIQMAR